MLVNIAYLYVKVYVGQLYLSAVLKMFPQYCRTRITVVGERKYISKPLSILASFLFTRVQLML